LLLNLGSFSLRALKQIVELSWASTYINTFIPTSIAGEVFKFNKLKDLERPPSKSATVVSIFVGKVASFQALLLISSFALIIYKNPSLPSSVVLIVHFVSLLSLASIFIKGSVESFFINRMKETKIKRLLVSLKNVGKTKLFTSLLISMLIQGLNIILIILIMLFMYNFQEPLLKSIFPVTLSLSVSQLPLSLSGIGIGHVTFEHLLSNFGFENGAVIFNSYVVMKILFNLSGSFFLYKLWKKK
jgi:uncharacterized membrane protein YbhN (UPF0104 family)